MQMKAFAGHLVRIERQDGSGRLVIRRKSDGEQHIVTLAEEAFSPELASVHDFPDAYHPFLLFLACHAETDFRLQHGNAHTRVAQTAEASQFLGHVVLCRAA
jgi:hypothetical protein